jgi:hypothetical protein
MKTSQQNHNISSIDGAYNMIRLEGKIGKKKKIIYLILFDDRGYQYSGCSDGQGIDIKDYLVEQFDKSTELIDFFLEISPKDIERFSSFPGLDCQNGECVRTSGDTSYLNKIKRLFTSIYQRKTFGNLRLHPCNITNILSPTKAQDPHFLDFGDTYTSLHFTYDAILFFIYNENIIRDIDNEIIFQSVMLNAILENPEPLSENTPDVLTTALDLIDKIKNNFIHSNIHQKLVPLIEKAGKYLKISYDTVNDLKTLLAETRNQIEKVGNTLFFDPISSYGYQTSIPQIHVINLVAKIMDMVQIIRYTGRVLYISTMVQTYILRRILDQDTIVHSLVYANDQRLFGILAVLVKTFDFNVTHISYHSSEIQTIDEINKKLRETPDGEYVFLLKPIDVTLRTCINSSTMPADFIWF